MKWSKSRQPKNWWECIIKCFRWLNNDCTVIFMTFMILMVSGGSLKLTIALSVPILNTYSCLYFVLIGTFLFLFLKKAREKLNKLQASDWGSRSEEVLAVGFPWNNGEDSWGQFYQRGRRESRGWWLTPSREVKVVGQWACSRGEHGVGKVKLRNPLIGPLRAWNVLKMAKVFFYLQQQGCPKIFKINPGPASQEGKWHLRKLGEMKDGW